MKHRLPVLPVPAVCRAIVPILFALSLGACKPEGSVADDARPAPDLDIMTTTPGNWSRLGDAIGRTPAESGLLIKSPIVTDLDAMMGARAIAYRKMMIGRGGALRRDGRYLVSVTPPGPGAAYLVIDPQQHSLDAGMLADDGWTFKRTAAAEMALPAAVRALTGR